MEKLKKNRKVVIISALIILALIAGGVYAATKDADNPSKAKITTQSEEKVKKVKQATTEQKEAEKALEEAKASGDEKAIKEAEAKVEKAQGKIKAGSSAGGSTQNSSAPGEANKKKVWIVDKAAWTETVQEPIYSYRSTWWIKFADGSIKTYYDKSEWINAQNYNDDNGIIYSYGNGQDEQYISGYNTKTVNHPEEGHWEYR